MPRSDKYKSFVAALDIGTDKISCIIATTNFDDNFDVISYASQNSEGISHSSIIHAEAAEVAISDTLDEALERAEIKDVDYFIVNLSAGLPKNITTKHKIQLSDQSITRAKLLNWQDISNFQVHDKGYLELVQAFPVAYYLDGEMVIEPVGMHGNILEIEMLLTLAPIAPLKNLSKSLYNAKIYASDHIPANIASSIACLSEEEMRLGSICLDIGAGSISWCVWNNGYFVQGGENKGAGLDTTKDIAHVFSISLEEAERLKILKGNVVFSPVDDFEVIEVRQINHDDEDDVIEIQQKQLTQLMRYRLSKTLGEIEQKIKSIPNISHIKRIIVTGGGANIVGIDMLIAEIFGKEYNIKISSPYLQSLPNELQKSSWSCNVGLLQYFCSSNYVESDYIIKRSYKPKSMKKNILTVIKNIFS